MRTKDMWKKTGDAIANALKGYRKGTWPAMFYESILWILVASTEDPKIALAMRQAAAIGETAKTDLIYQLAFSASWKLLGRPVFKLTPGLTAALMLTELPDTDLNELRLPFPSMWVEIPHDVITFADEKGERYSCNQFSVQESFDPDIYDTWTDEEIRKFVVNMGHLVTRCAMQIAEQGPPGPYLGEEVFHSVVGEIGGLVKRRWRMEGFIKDKVNIYTNSSPMRDGMTIREWLEYRDGYELSSDGELFVDDTDDMALAAMHRLTINLALYLEMKMERDGPLNVIRKEKGRRSGFSIYKVGSEVKLPEGLIKSARAYAHAGVQPEGWKMQRRFTVRGHWRNQPCGPGRKERKRIFIEPHWKGPETAEEMSRLYEAKTLEEAGLTDS